MNPNEKPDSQVLQDATAAETESTDAIGEDSTLERPIPEKQEQVSILDISAGADIEERRPTSSHEQKEKDMKIELDRVNEELEYDKVKQIVQQQQHVEDL